uniref:DUF1648 domain-containing protein n=1 Tax=Physcomitrium patens TaxID=3218 RepID=A0A7I4BR78_PHYPA
MGSSPVVLAVLLFLGSLAITLYNAHSAPWHHLPIWWDLFGNPWIYGPRWVALLSVPVLTLLVPLFYNMAALRNYNLLHHGAASKQSVFNIIVLPALFLFTIQAYVILPAETDPSHKFPARIFVSNTAIWVLVWFGHNLKYVEQNNVVGIISPWTTDANWDALHSQAGLIFELCGTLLFILSFVVPIGWPMLVTLLVLWLGPWVISFILAYSKSNYTSEPLLGVLTTRNVLQQHQAGCGWL